MRLCVAVLFLVTVVNATKLTLVKEKKSQSDAENYCSGKHLILVRDTSSSKHSEIVDLIKANGLDGNDFWVNGDIKSKKEVDCTDGKKLKKYLPWQSGQPDGSGSSLHLWAAASYNWDDTPGSNTKYFICEEPELYHVSKKKSYDDAESYCKQHGMILAKDTSKDKHNDIVNLIKAKGKSKNDHWINGNPIKSKSKVDLSDGDYYDQYTKWAFPQPDGSGSCVQLMEKKSLEWDDDSCSIAKYFVCGKVDTLRVLTSKKKYSDALSDCEARGMTLFKDTSCYKHNAALEALDDLGMSSTDVWINGNPVTTSKTVLTSDGENLNCYQPWSSGNPSGNGKCLQLWAAKSHDWDDDGCSVKKEYICESE